LSEAVKPVDDTADSLAIENAIFDAALQLTDPAQRAEFLDRIFYGDPLRRKGMAELLEMAGTASGYFLDARTRTAQLAREVLDEFREGMFAEGAITFGASSEELKEIWVSTVPKIGSTT